MSKPLVSVCLLTYNQAKYVKEAVDTILMQKVDFAWELIIADDCSTDGTQKILLEYEKKFPDLIRLLLRKKNVGPEENWLGLMEQPKSKYVVYAEGDDYFSDPKKLQKQVDFLEAHDGFSLCFHPVTVMYEDGSKPDEIFPSPKQRFNKDTLELKDLLRDNFIQTNSAMYRWRFIKENIQDVYPKGVTPGDWFLHILHAEKGKIGFIDEPMSVYRRHPGGLWWDAHNDRTKFWEKYGLSWLKFYVELLKMYGSDPECRRITEGSVINLLDSLAKADKQSHGDMFYKAIASFPEAAKVYTDNLRGQIADLRGHADKQAEIIKHYVDLSGRLESENEALNSKKIVRVRKAVGKRVRSRKV